MPVEDALLGLPGGALAPPRDRATGEPVHAEIHYDPHVWTATGLERPVFLDQSGRRRRRVRLAGAGAALLSSTWLAALVTGGMGFSTLPAVQAAGALAGPPHAIVRAAPRHRRAVTVAQLSPTEIASVHEAARIGVGDRAGTILR